MASMSGEDINSAASSVTVTRGKALASFRRAAGLLSHTATSSASSRRSRFRTTFGPQYPYPTTPNLTTASPRCPFFPFEFCACNNVFVIVIKERGGGGKTEVEL